MLHSWLRKCGSVRQVCKVVFDTINFETTVETIIRHSFNVNLTTQRIHSQWALVLFTDFSFSFHSSNVVPYHQIIAIRYAMNSSLIEMTVTVNLIFFCNLKYPFHCVFFFSFLNLSSRLVRRIFSTRMVGLVYVRCSVSQRVFNISMELIILL